MNHQTFSHNPCKWGKSHHYTDFPESVHIVWWLLWFLLLDTTHRLISLNLYILCGDFCGFYFWTQHTDWFLWICTYCVVTLVVSTFGHNTQTDFSKSVHIVCGCFDGSYILTQHADFLKSVHVWQWLWCLQHLRHSIQVDFPKPLHMGYGGFDDASIWDTSLLPEFCKAVCKVWQLQWCLHLRCIYTDRCVLSLVVLMFEVWHYRLISLNLCCSLWWLSCLLHLRHSTTHWGSVYNVWWLW